MSTPERERRPLDVHADLDVTVAGADLRVRADGDLVVVTAPSVRAAFALLRAGRALPLAFESVAGGLDAADVTVLVRARGRTLATLGVGATPGVLSRALGVAPAELDPVAVLSALLLRSRE
ncbi:peptide ABC transporter ATP-binding protein [Halobium salinum]|uniref:Peptide ABC transporter ATP-binding protein n=1 Tax=Halobium salinum TaxID=1364940 RepID=A0ABD5P683_9EURY|nr:peptide ABC transporter ATP-binding protein [Halobium salinum]